MEDLIQNYLKSDDYKLMKDIYALHDFLQVKDEDIINKGCLIEDLESFANGYITFLNKDGEKKILTNEEVANFEPEIIDGKKLYRIDFVAVNQKRLAQNEDDFNEIWDKWLNDKKLDSLTASVESLKKLLIVETQQFQKLHEDNTNAKQRDLNLINLSDRFINYLTKTTFAKVEEQQKKVGRQKEEKVNLSHKEIYDEYMRLTDSNDKKIKKSTAKGRLVNITFKEMFNQGSLESKKARLNTILRKFTNIN